MAPSPVRLVVVDGDSMRPALEPGDRLLVLRLPIRVGHVVAVRRPDVDLVVVKRVAALDGDQVTLVGDNRDHSTDSRSFGPVPRAAILGRAVYRYAPSGRVGSIPS
jgi:nickel-type superoxide dismutase maturation protease